MRDMESVESVSSHAKNTTLRPHPQQLKEDLKDKTTTNASEISNVKIQHLKILQQMRDAFEVNLRELGGRCEGKLGDLGDDLELRRKVDIHEVRPEESACVLRGGATPFLNGQLRGEEKEI